MLASLTGPANVGGLVSLPVAPLFVFPEPDLNPAGYVDVVEALHLPFAWNRIIVAPLMRAA